MREAAAALCGLAQVLNCVPQRRASACMSTSTLSTAASLIATSNNIIVMVGAGISVNAGIPDFRTPGTGLYDNLEEYGLPYPEAIFEMDFFEKNPRPFYQLCKSLWPGSFQPTATHHLLRLLHDRGKLLRCYTQNIDSLESAAGLPAAAIVAAHGNFDSASVIRGGPAVPAVEVEAAAKGGMDAWDALNAKYGGLCKPDIVFFGEQLPRRFFELLVQDFPLCDLLLVLGTSLAVHPFASLIAHVPPGCPRILINRDRVGERMPMRPSGPAGPFNFNSGAQTDLLHLGDCDEAVSVIAEQLGWKDELACLCEGATVAISKNVEESAKDVPMSWGEAPCGFTWADRLF